MDARDMYYQAVFTLGQKEERLDSIYEEANEHLARAKALDERVQRNMKLVNQLTEDLKVEMARPAPKPWWKRLLGL